jgi:hypothetical protein
VDAGVVVVVTAAVAVIAITIVSSANRVGKFLRGQQLPPRCPLLSHSTYKITLLYLFSRKRETHVKEN